MEKPAIEGGNPVRNTFLPFMQPWITEEEISEVASVLRSGWLTTGPKVLEFESKFKEYLGAKHAVAVNSCTGGLHISLAVLGIGPGDEVITSPLTFASTANVIVLRQGKPVFADIKKDTFNIDPEKVEGAIGNKTKAIIPVHYGGQPCDMDAIMTIAGSNNLHVIEDAAHAVGAEYKGKRIGATGNLTSFSFYAIKNMTTGEGGMITTEDEALADEMRSWRLHGISKDAWKRYEKTGSWYYEIEHAGFKYNMMDLQAAMGLVQLKRLDGFIETRQKYARYLTERLNGLLELHLPVEKGDVKRVWQLYPILVETDRLKIERGRFIEALAAENIGTSVHFIPLHLHPFYRETFGYKRGDFPNAEYVYDRLVSLPLYPKMSLEDLDDVVRAVIRIIEYYRK